MNTAHTPQALSLPHLQIAEASARRQAENDAFDRAAARLQPAWVRAEVREPALRDVTMTVRAPTSSLGKAIRKDAKARANAEADRYRRQLLGELERSQRNLRRWFIAGFVAACAVLALSETRAPAQAHPETRATAAAPTAKAGPEHAPARPVKAATKPVAR